jgi:hypothetical protein
MYNWSKREGEKKIKSDPPQTTRALPKQPTKLHPSPPHPKLPIVSSRVSKYSRPYILFTHLYWFCFILSSYLCNVLSQQRLR